MGWIGTCALGAALALAGASASGWLTLPSGSVRLDPMPAGFTGARSLTGWLYGDAATDGQHGPWSRDTPIDAASAVTAGNADRGSRLVEVHGCAACHEIPGIAGADGSLGPPLGGPGRQRHGRVQGQPEGLIQWIVEPTAHSPFTLMPAIGASEAEARDMAAYLHMVGTE